MSSALCIINQPLTSGSVIHPVVRAEEIFRCQNKICAIGDTYQQSNLLFNFKSSLNLDTVYMEHNQINSESIFLSGGLQQYLIKENSHRIKSNFQPRKGFQSDTVTFHDLPDSLQLEIFSYLDARELCQISSVCTHWLLLSADDLLWKRRLEQDLKTWNVISNITNPDIYDECKADYTGKQIYLRCSPLVKQCLLDRKSVDVYTISQFVANTVRSFLPKKIPKFAMFGPGLESSTSSIMRRIIEGQSDMFKPTGMFPGQFGGIGSGLTMQMNNSTTFNLVALYTSTWKERQSTPYNERLKINRLLQHRPEKQDNDDVEGEETFEVNSAIKDLCRVLDGFVFVVDASNTDEAAMKVARSELLSMVNEKWCKPTAPLLVLSCLIEGDIRNFSCIDVVRKLNLSHLNRPWQVHNCIVDCLSGIVPAIDWIVETAQRK